MTRSLLILFAATLFGCGYGYAGQRGKARTEKVEPTSVKVVTVKESDPAPVAEEPEPEAQPSPAESPCGVPTFQIHYLGEQDLITKSVDCVRRSIVEVSRTPRAQSDRAAARDAGLPEGSWYLLVDPKGERPDQLTNSDLLKLSRQFEVDYFGRDTTRDLLVYLYTDSPR